MTIQFRIPITLSGELLGNLLGLFGLLGITVAVGGLTGNWWWSLLAGSVFCVGLSYVATVNTQAAERERAPVRPVTSKAS